MNKKAVQAILRRQGRPRPAEKGADSAIDGMITPGNLEQWKREVLRNPDGSVSTTSSMSIGTDRGEVLIPTVVDGRRLPPDKAVALYIRTGKHLGVFRDSKSASRYAAALHDEQERRMGGRK